MEILKKLKWSQEVIRSIMSQVVFIFLGTGQSTLENSIHITNISFLETQLNRINNKKNIKKVILDIRLLSDPNEVIKSSRESHNSLCWKPRKNQERYAYENLELIFIGKMMSNKFPNLTRQSIELMSFLSNMTSASSLVEEDKAYSIAYCTGITESMVNKNFDGFLNYFNIVRFNIVINTVLKLSDKEVRINKDYQNIMSIKNEYLENIKKQEIIDTLYVLASVGSLEKYNLNINISTTLVNGGNRELPAKSIVKNIEIASKNLSTSERALFETLKKQPTTYDISSEAVELIKSNNMIIKEMQNNISKISIDLNQVKKRKLENMDASETNDNEDTSQIKEMTDKLNRLEIENLDLVDQITTAKVTEMNLKQENEQLNKEIDNLNARLTQSDQNIFNFMYNEDDIRTLQADKNHLQSENITLEQKSFANVIGVSYHETPHVFLENLKLNAQNLLTEDAHRNALMQLNHQDNYAIVAKKGNGNKAKKK